MADSVADFIAVYGSLRRGMQAAHKMESSMEFVGTGFIDASLYALGWYPGVKLGTGGLTAVDVFKLPEDPSLREAILYDLDNYEGYNERNLEGSLFVRKVVPLFERGYSDDLCLDEVYVYEYNYPVNRAPLVKGGNWAGFCQGDKNEYNSIPH
jgi:gamma-glutamylcyclotransferase (GGCT)/AIG2-like uncharacterized protein YtfP